MKTNSLIYKTSKEISVINNNGNKTTGKIYVKIRLDDQCKNGHQDFAITGDIYAGSGKADRNHLTGGCIHEEIVKHFSSFKSFILAVDDDKAGHVLKENLIERLGKASCKIINWKTTLGRRCINMNIING
jgi:hypothetical protein